MKVKLLALAFLVTVLALASQPAAKASVVCPAYTCYQVLQNCLNSGGAPWSEESFGTCFTVPSYTEYTMYSLNCYNESTDSFHQQECYR